MRRSYQSTLSTAILMSILVGSIAVVSLATSTEVAGATAPGCTSIKTDTPHKSSLDPVVRVHALTNCRGTGATFVDVSTDLFRNGYYVSSGWREGLDYARSTADKNCPTSGTFSARSSHTAVIKGVWYQPASTSASVYVSC